MAVALEELDALETAACDILSVPCVVLEPGCEAPPGPPPGHVAFLNTAPLVIRLVRAYRDTLQTKRSLIDVWRENDRLRKRVAELETANCKDAE